MDTGASHETPLLTLAHLVHDETSFVAAEDGHTWQGQTGHAQWSSEPTGPARATLDMLLHAARAIGHDVPESLTVQAGQLFYRHGRLEEVRLAGVVTRAPHAADDTTAPTWSTPTPPTMQEASEGTICLRPDDVGRRYLAVLVVPSETDPAHYVVACHWDLTGEVFAVVSRERPSSSLPKHPSVPTAFPDDRGRFPNNPLIAAGMAAIWKGGAKARILQAGWQDTEVGRPVYQHTGKKGGRILVYPNLGRSASDPLPTAAALWDMVEHFNPFTADVALAVLAQLCEPSVGQRPQAPLLESVRITADAILQYKGIQRWGHERQLLHERVFEEMERLRSIQFDIDQYPERNPDTGKWDPRGVSWQGDRLFDIVQVELYQESLFGDCERIEVSWLVRAGQWAHWWLNAQGRVWIGRMARILLEFDHRKNRGSAIMAKKIGQRMVLLSEALRVSEPITRRIDHLLEDIGELPTPEKRNKDWVGRTRKRVESGVHMLQDAGVLAVEWPAGYSSIPNRLWLGTKIDITLPVTPPALPSPTRHSSRALHARQRRRTRRSAAIMTQRVDGMTVRHTRQERYWSQKTLAAHLGISIPYLSQIENDKRLPSKALHAKLQQWLREPQET